ncbi:hypothetical protein Cni_G21660 [Canna indica]|uniref:Glabrous enhancer-binding protein-like DBD domain-containing protein n=1 Tax=Canna indica TaxID=4628 RepID=A0AAQ3KSM6_9LILI|nr:hypothetical protein Cni_G21660 [Canna indica]
MSEGAPSGAARSTGHRKHKAQEHPSGGEKSPGSGQKRSSKSSSDHPTILRGALEFRNRTGQAPTKSNMDAFYDSVKDSLPNPLSKNQLYNKLRTIRHNFNHSADDDDDDLVLKLAAELWPEVVKKGKDGKVPKKQKKRSLDALEEDENMEEEVKVGKILEKEKTQHSDALEDDRNMEKEMKVGKGLKKEKKRNLDALEEDGNVEKEKNVGKSPKKEKNQNLGALQDDQYVEKDKEAENLGALQVQDDHENSFPDEKSKKGKNKKLTAEQHLITLEKEDTEEGLQDKNGEAWGIEPAQFPYLTQNAAAHWETYDLNKKSLEMGMNLADPAKAKILEGKWTRLSKEEMKTQMNLATIRKELFAIMLAAHKGIN